MKQNIEPDDEDLGRLSFSDLEISWSQDDQGNQPVKIVHFKGKINQKNSFWLNQKFYKIDHSNLGKLVILDLSELSYMNSVGLAILHSMIFQIKKNNAQVVIGGVHPFIKKIFTLIEGIQNLKVFDSCAEAKKSLLWQYHL